MVHSTLRGFLNIVVLKALAEQSTSGYALMKFIKDRIGVKPSAGSIYPLLDSLRKKGLIEIKSVGRAKEYRITSEGKAKLSMIEQKRDECMCQFLEGMKMITALTGEDMTFPMAMVERMRTCVVPFKEINPEWNILRMELFNRMTNDTLKRDAPKIRKILAKAVQGLKKV